VFEHTPNLKILALDSNPFCVIDDPTMMAIVSLALLEVR
jgi:hypothetical protein